MNFVLPDMSCGHCRTAVSEAVIAVPGVTTVDVDLDAGRVRVDGPGADADAVRGAIEDAGYEVQPA